MLSRICKESRTSNSMCATVRAYRQKLPLLLQWRLRHEEVTQGYFVICLVDLWEKKILSVDLNSLRFLCLQHNVLTI